MVYLLFFPFCCWLGQGTFKEICDFVEKQYESQLNWKLERCELQSRG